MLIVQVGRIVRICRSCFSVPIISPLCSGDPVFKDSIAAVREGKPHSNWGIWWRIADRSVTVK